MNRKNGLLVFCVAILFLLGTVLSAQETTSAKGFVNAKELADSLGVTFQWFPIQKAVVLTRDGRVMRLTVDSKESIIDDKVVALPVAPKLEDGQMTVPARFVLQVFGGKAVAPDKRVELGPETPAGSDDPDEEEPQTPVVVAPAPPKIISDTPDQEEEEDEGTILKTVRHSMRDDHTRVVLEFTGNVSFKTEMVGENKFKVRIEGCKNIIPTSRSNPTGRDIKGIAFNSGPNRTGLVVTVDLAEGSDPPSVETVGNPFRMILACKGVAGAIASPTPPLNSASGTAQVSATLASDTAKVKTPGLKTATATAKVLPKKEAGSPEGTPEVPPALVASLAVKVVKEETYDFPLA